MKQLGICFLLFILSLNAFSQDVRGGRLIANESVYLRNTRVDSILNDTINWKGKIKSLVTADAIERKLRALIIAGGVTDTSHLSDRIDDRLKKSDSLNKWFSRAFMNTSNDSLILLRGTVRVAVKITFSDTANRWYSKAEINGTGDSLILYKGTIRTALKLPSGGSGSSFSVLNSIPRGDGTGLVQSTIRNNSTNTKIGGNNTFTSSLDGLELVSGGGDGSKQAFLIKDNTTGNYLFTVLVNGNTGLGTNNTNPQATLHVIGTTILNGSMKMLNLATPSFDTVTYKPLAHSLAGDVVEAPYWPNKTDSLKYTTQWKLQQKLDSLNIALGPTVTIGNATIANGFKLLKKVNDTTLYIRALEQGTAIILTRVGTPPNDTLINISVNQSTIQGWFDTWYAANGGGGGGGGISTVSSVSSTPTDNGMSISGSTIRLHIMDQTHAGIIAPGDKFFPNGFNVFPGGVKANYFESVGDNFYDGSLQFNNFNKGIRAANSSAESRWVFYIDATDTTRHGSATNTGPISFYGNALTGSTRRMSILNNGYMFDVLPLSADGGDSMTVFFNPTTKLLSYKKVNSSGGGGGITYKAGNFSSTATDKGLVIAGDSIYLTAADQTHVGGVSLGDQFMGSGYKYFSGGVRVGYLEAYGDSYINTGNIQFNNTNKGFAWVNTSLAQRFLMYLSDQDEVRLGLGKTGGAWRIYRSAISDANPLFGVLDDGYEFPVLPAAGTGDDYAVAYNTTSKKISYKSFHSGGGGSGEVNTASNLTGGVGVYSGKVGVDLQFYPLNSTEFINTSNVLYLKTGGIAYSKLTEMPTARILGNVTGDPNSPGFIDADQLTSGFVNLAGTAGLITVTGTTTKTITIASTYAGQSSITVVGTIGTGLWQGTPIATAYGGVPTGGTTGQVLAKSSNSNYALTWVDQTSGGGGSASYTFTPSDFNESGSTVSIDYVNGQSASNSTKGFLSAADWVAFNAKQSLIDIPANFIVRSQGGGSFIASDIFNQQAKSLGFFTATPVAWGVDVARSLWVRDSMILSYTPVSNSTDPLLTRDGIGMVRQSGISVSDVALKSLSLSQFATTQTTSSQLAAIMNDESGTGALVLNVNPSISGATLTSSTINGVAISNTGSATEFLNKAGGYVASVQTTDHNLKVTGNTITTNTAIQTLTDGATITMDPTNGINGKVTLSGNRTLSITSPQVGKSYTITVSQDATAGRTLTLPGGNLANIYKSGNAITKIIGFYDGSNWEWYSSKAGTPVRSIRPVTTSSSIVLGDDIINCIQTSAITLTLPSVIINETGGGQEFTILNRGTGTVTINPMSGEVLESGPISLAAGKQVKILAGGSSWIISFSN